jgi:YfiH family protein
VIQSSLLSSIPGIAHGFGTAAELVPPPLRAGWPRRPVKHQVHGTHAAAIVTPEQQVGDADAFYTRETGIPVSVITADCVPLLMARRDGAMVGAVHAGWRGLYDGIVERLWASWRAQGENPADWVAAIGPYICGPCYEVSVELAQQFLERYPELPPELVCPKPRHLDLGAIVEARLRALGVGEVERLACCTMTARDEHGAYLFRSYRRGDRQSQQHAGLVILPR